MIILRRELGPIIYRFSIKIMVHLPLTVKKGRVKSMKKKSKYQLLYKLYPPVITKDQFYRICNISKKTAAHLLDNGLVPCVIAARKQENTKSNWRTSSSIWKQEKKILDDMLPHPDGTRPMVNLMRRIS